MLPSKRIVIGIVVISASFVAGARGHSVAALHDPGSIKQKRSSETAQPITVAYCDLLRNPKEYDRKLVRVKAIYASYFEL